MILIWFFFAFGLIMQMTNIDKLHEMVKSSLFQFVNQHITAADLSVVDEIVLNYVIAILEEATEDPNFDVEGKNRTEIYSFFDVCEFSRGSSREFFEIRQFIHKYFGFSSKGLVEMMSAYFPDFSQIETTKVCEWIFELANEMSKKKSNPENHSNEASKK